ncbi:MAG: glycosyl transferase family 1 [Nitrosomonadaceae bacterium]|nr:glycosyl transferase family 1 [Nitrosomonadaceae bacterium]
MRICFISHSSGQHGAELALLELLEGLVKLGVSCMVIVPKEGPLISELEHLKIPWEIASYPRWLSRPIGIYYRLARNIISLIRSVQVAKIAKQWNCDIVYSNTSSISVGAFGAWLANKPHVWHLHESGYKMGLKYDLGEFWTARLINSLSAAIIVVSHSLKKYYSQYIPSSKMSLVYQSVTRHNKIEKTYKSNRDNQIFQCLIISSLHPYKGQIEAIKALSELIQKGINIQLLIIGHGWKNFQLELFKQVKEHNLEQYVEFIGYKKNPMEYLQSTDTVLICSQWEAFGRVTIEAMLAGKPVIGSAAGATAELIQDGITGLLYNSGDHLELANKIQYLYENLEERLKIGASARNWADNRFTQERHAKEIFNILEELLKKRNQL